MIRVLVVDDDDAFRQTVCDLLANGDFEILSAESGAKSFAVLRNQPVDIVLTDIVMPDEDGLEIVRKINKMNPAPKIVAMSGGGRIAATDYLKMAKLMGASATIPKPFKQQQLVDLLQQVFSSPSKRAENVSD
jgi:DNA-binding NtrC family response regulator